MLLHSSNTEKMCMGDTRECVNDQYIHLGHRSPTVFQISSEEQYWAGKEVAVALCRQDVGEN